VKANEHIPVLKVFTALGEMLVTRAEGVDRSRLTTKPNVVRIEDGLMTAAAFNALPATTRATTFFSAEQRISAERAEHSDIEIDES
jgi:hypothetical protein